MGEEGEEGGLEKVRLYCEAGTLANPIVSPALAGTWRGGPPMWVASGSEMVGDGVSPGADLREAVYRGMLREARIDEARKLDAALKCIEEEGNGFGGAVEVLDRLLREWEE